MTEIDMGLTEKRAIKYARWLAHRDGIHIPEKSEAEAVWGNHTHVRYVAFYFVNEAGEKDVIDIEIPNWNWEPTKEAA